MSIVHSLHIIGVCMYKQINWMVEQGLLSVSQSQMSYTDTSSHSIIILRADVKPIDSQCLGRTMDYMMKVDLFFFVFNCNGGWECTDWRIKG